MTTSWQRAQTERDRGGPINDAERMVYLQGSDKPRRVVWALEDGELRAECDCPAGTYRQWCAHLASLWWRWSRGRLSTTHLTTGLEYQYPPSWFRLEGLDVDMSDCTPAETDVYLACEVGNVGVREYARHTDRSPGTVGNLLRRARGNVEGEQ